MTLPVSRYSPSRGITVNRTKRTVTITGRMLMYGPEATTQRAATATRSINTHWTTQFPDGYSITCRVSISYSTSSSPSGGVTRIYVARITGPSNVSGSFGNYSMELNANSASAFTWTAAHEFGHILGLQDRYSESIISRLGGQLGFQRSTPPNPGYGTNMMAIHGGTVESQNIRDLQNENNPSPYWMNDDDYLRNWIAHHSIREIGVLSTSDKLNMFVTLMSFWISDADVNAMIKICQSVRLRSEANVIRSRIRLNNFSSIGQRMRMMIAFSQMPE